MRPEHSVTLRRKAGGTSHPPLFANFVTVMSKTLLTLEVRVFIVSVMLGDADPQGIPAQPQAHKPQASAIEATPDSCCFQEYQNPARVKDESPEKIGMPPPIIPATGGEDDMTELISLLSSLSPSKRRLVRELIFSLAQLERQTIPKDHDQRLDYQAHIDTWLQSLVAQGISAETIRVYKRNIKTMLAHHPHPTQTHLEAFLADLIAKGRTASTISGAIDAAKSFFGYLAERAVACTNPAAGLRRPRRGDRLRKPATQEQIRALFRACHNEKYRLMLMLLCDTGIRISELATIKSNRISRDSIVITGKGNKARHVPISSQTAAAIQLQLRYLEATSYPGPWLFPGREPTVHIAADSIRDYVYYLCRLAGIPRVTPHQLRHFFATSTLSAGASLKAISAILGHARTSTTVNTYWHIVDQREVASQHAQFSPLKGVQWQEQK